MEKCSGCLQNEKEIQKVKIELERLKSDKQLNDYKHQQTMQLLKEIQEDVKEIKESPNKIKWITITALITTGVALIIPVIINK